MTTTASTPGRRGRSSAAWSRLPSAVAVAAVVAVALVAGLDSLRSDPAPVPAGVRGELVYSDAACRRHAVRLPDLARRDFLTVGCGVFTRRDNLGVRDGVVAWFAYPVPGGTTTVLRNTAVQAVAWLGGRRFAAVLAGGRLTIWEGERLLHVLERGSYRDLRASPAGTYFAAVDRGELVVFDREGLPVPILPGRAIAWSPDERLAAVAWEDELVVVTARTGEPLARIEARARDVDWRLP